MTNAETQLASYFANYSPAIAELGNTLRAQLRARLPGFFELVYVYENQGALVICYSPTERGYEGVCTISVYSQLVKLGFGRGAELRKSDSKKVLRGSGKTVRFVELSSVEDLERAEIEALITEAVKLANVRLDQNTKGAMIIKAEEQKQRAHRATKSTPPEAAGHAKASQSKTK